MAGCCAAKKLENSGCNFIVFETFNFPRKKLCGGGLTEKSLNLLTSLFPDVEKCVKVKSNRVYFVNENSILETSKKVPFIFLTDRKVLDYTIFSSLKSPNIHTGEKVLSIEKEKNLYIIKTDRDKYRVYSIIGSDGVNSLVSRFCGFKIKKGITYEIDIEGNTGNSVVVDFTNLKHGYYWIFPKGDYYTTGFGIFSKYKLRNPYELNRKYNLKFKLNRKEISKGGAFVPVFNGKLFPGKERILLAGDAANLVDPFTGEGIYFAALSGIKAAELLLNSKTPLTDYEKFLNKNFLSDFRWSNFLRHLFFAFKKPFFKGMEKSEALLKIATDIISGNVCYKEAFKRFVIKSTLLPARFLNVTGVNKAGKREKSKGFSSLDI
nr:NAD(P)/FAD-dependent oxidoreductase [Desulfurobacterium atlanticum]